ncbi:MAG: outer membrane beta-barrel protein [Bacteroidetes bacterium]|nr:outer membrane beta-barrel protein [Bacteroidota bacterium]MCW5895790.1 outer membrane beta-barrel protein [Bacteroidota bacterium]
MKRGVLILATLTILCATSLTAGPISFGLQATGANINIDGPLKEVYGFGFGGGAHLDINLPVLFAIRIQADYVTFSPDNGKYQALIAGLIPGSASADFSIDGGRINIFSANANGKLSPLPLPIISPYITGGIGLANVGASDATVKFQGNPVQGGTIPGSKSETNTSANLGVGVDLDLLVLKLYLEARYTWIFASGATSTYIPVSLGVTF